MLQPMPKQEYLAELQARNRHNRQIMETVFAPLDQAQRGWQPAPKEWSVDQCFQHLVLAFERFVPNTTQALNTPESPDSAGIFKQSWWARRLFPIFFDPNIKSVTLPSFNPKTTNHPGVIGRYLAQQDRLSGMIDQAMQADLQVMCWYFKPVLIRYNLGDYLNNFVSHDELHIDQAQRVLAAYGQRVEVSTAISK